MPLAPLDESPEGSSFAVVLPLLALAGGVLVLAHASGRHTLSGSAELVEGEEALESIVQAERALRAISGCTPQSLIALQDAEREIGKAISAADGADPEVRRTLKKRISGLTRMASQANASLTRCITRK
jgi:hypothetical protein